MFFISKTLVRSGHVFKSKLYILDQFPFSKSISTCSIDPKLPSFEASYLINSCGLSPESALKASKLIRFKTLEKPDSVLAFFKKHGFSETQISKLIKGAPKFIKSNPEKTLLPKLQFFYSKGISVPDLAKILSANPDVLRRSLENQLIPTFDFLAKFLQSKDKTINAIKHFPRILEYDFHRHIAPIIDILRNHGVPESNIIMLFTSNPRVIILRSSESFSDIIEQVKKMGFDPSKAMFIIAVDALCSMSKPTWEGKVQAYKKWGWSHEEILQAFRKHPGCMKYSEEMISAKMDFFVNKMGWDPSIVACRSQYMSLSLEKRIIPRCSVLVKLLSKDLIKKKYSVALLLESNEKIFLQRYVNCYKDEAPHLLKIYREKLGGATEREAIVHNFHKNGL